MNPESGKTKLIEENEIVPHLKFPFKMHKVFHDSDIFSNDPQSPFILSNNYLRALSEGIFKNISIEWWNNKDILGSIFHSGISKPSLLY